MGFEPATRLSPKRPFEIWSITAAILATTAGWKIMVWMVPHTPMRLVASAKPDMVVIDSSV